MKTTRSLFALGLLLAGLFLGGCSTFESRSEEKAAVFNALPADAKMRLEKGDIRLGDTPDMVYIALGEPDSKVRQSDASGTAEVWIYGSYYQRYQGSTVTFAPQYVTGPRGRVIAAGAAPIYRDYYGTEYYERSRIVFRDGRAAEISVAE